MSKNKMTNLSWDKFQSLGDPNAEVPDLDPKEIGKVPDTQLTDKIRVYIEKKGRAGKTVSLVKGLSLGGNELDQICKTIKSACGVGGKIENGIMMIQGDQRKKIIEFFKSRGYKDIKDAGV